MAVDKYVFESQGPGTICNILFDLSDLSVNLVGKTKREEKSKTYISIESLTLICTLLSYL